jgi:cytochrome b involved in lipid metabolism
MKQENKIGVIFSILILILTGYYIFNYQKNQSLSKKIIQTPNTISQNNIDVILNKTEVSRHSTPTDCWFIVSNKVYVVSSYISQHPGGAKNITDYCGQDATVVYSNKGGKGSHSSRADQELASLFIGNINEKIQNAPNKITLPVSKRKEEDDDD